VKKDKRVMVRFTEEEYDWLQATAPGGSIAPYIRETVLGLAKKDRKLVNMDDKLVELGQDMRLVTDMLSHLDRKVSGKPTAPGATVSQEPGGIPEELVGMVLEILLLTRHNSNRQDIKMAQGQVERIHLPVWSGGL
jgi:hypothetical protein